MIRKSPSTRKLLSWLVASLLGGVFLVGFGYAKHLFEGEWRWLAVGGVTVCWLVISAATWIAAKDIDRADSSSKSTRGSGNPAAPQYGLGPTLTFHR